MNNMKKFLAVNLAAFVFLSGCTALEKKPRQICPAKFDADAVLSGLENRLVSFVPVKAAGSAIVRIGNCGNCRKSQQFTFRLWIEPPDRLCIYGDLFLSPMALCAARNEYEFWMYIRDGINSYWRGDNEELTKASYSCDGEFELMAFGPACLLEAVGAAEPDMQDSRWSLQKDRDYDILMEFDSAGLMKRRIYVDRCLSAIRRIDYFSGGKNPVVRVLADDYREQPGRQSFPGKIKIEGLSGAFRGQSINLKFDSISTVNLNDEQRKKLFQRPPSQGFASEYVMQDGKFISLKNPER